MIVVRDDDGEGLHGAGAWDSSARLGGSGPDLAAAFGDGATGFVQSFRGINGAPPARERDSMEAAGAGPRGAGAARGKWAGPYGQKNKPKTPGNRCRSRS